MEKNIIISHMFPIYPAIPRYKESILVDIVDKVIGLKEMMMEYHYKFRYQFNYTFIFLVLFMNK